MENVVLLKIASECHRNRHGNSLAISELGPISLLLEFKARLKTMEQHENFCDLTKDPQLTLTYKAGGNNAKLLGKSEQFISGPLHKIPCLTAGHRSATKQLTVMNKSVRQAKKGSNIAIM